MLFHTKRCLIKVEKKKTERTQNARKKKKNNDDGDELWDRKNGFLVICCWVDRARAVR